ncbi:cytochrome c [bacterium]|jgi:mono/diheme cytochrome c family protein|nr:cytochrome c [Verrucomicrobiales bacterium]MDA7643598.1 cytochrome c [Verrucomicrobiales bacterium]MDC0312549.1 cytochrome c [Verrucomicrobiales bacterium]MDC3255507.1 cytochrome c [bacterium]MDF1784462.1 cytochrome c [Verrucomicrobiales bacterium]
MRYFILGYVFLIALVVSVAGFRGTKSARSPIQVFRDMDMQAKSNAQSTSDFFASGQAAQEPVPGTIPMGWEVPTLAASAGGEANLDGYAFASDYLNTGKIGEYYGHGIPEEITVDSAFLERGQQKYGIYCAICHGESGNGAGVISKYGLLPTSLITAPVADPAQRPDGNIYDVVVNGKGLMGGYSARLTLRDRWSIVAYVRTLQQRKAMPAAEVQKAFDEAQGEAEPAAE